jgi:hypothetical protein
LNFRLATKHGVGIKDNSPTSQNEKKKMKNSAGTALTPTNPNEKIKDLQRGRR